jgi:serine/threonine-protein kinase
MPTVCPNCKHSNRDGARFCSTCRTPLTAGHSPTTVASPPTPSSLTGQLPANTMLFNRYLIVRKIGHGGMAAVYLVSDTHLAGKLWAVKEMSDAAITNPTEKHQAAVMFRQEMEILTRLHHRNIPHVVDTFTEGGKHFMVMEYVDGMTLEEYMERQGGRPFPEAQVRAWFHQLCSVLDYLHAQNLPIIFRDVKPDNIMVDRKGTIKLIDFGIARVFSPHKAHDTQSFGTAGYAAPEQYGQGQTDARSDVYGLGATLYRLLTGYDPTLTPMTLPPLEQFSVRISPDMREVIRRALEHDPARRWQSVREMAGALGIRLAEPSVVMVEPLPEQSPYESTVRVSPRPTTKLLMVMAEMSNQQLAMLAGALAVLFAIGAALLAPRISAETATALPLYLLAGPLAYAASHRRWATAAAHITVTGAVWLVASKWVNTGDDVALYVIGLLLSGLALEAILWVREQVWPNANPSQPQPWWQDCAWLAGVTAIGGLVALGVPSVPDSADYNWLRPWFPFSAAIVGAVGWFLGDLYHQHVLLKRAGFYSATK